MKNYISTVLSKIKDEKVKADIQAELEDHYNERVEYYTRIGYDTETSEEKANAHFGEEAEIIGEQISSINSKNVWRNVIFTAVNVLILGFVLLYALGAALVNAPFGNDLIGSITVLLFTAFAFIELFVALRNKSAYLGYLGAVGITAFCAIYQGYSPVVFGIYKLVKGEADHFFELIGSYDWKSTNIVIDVLSILFYAFCVALCLYAARLCRKFQKCEYGKRHMLREKKLKLVTKISMAVIIAMFAIITITFPKHYEHYENFFRAYVIESDEKTDPAEVENFEHNCLSVGWDFGSDFAEDENNAFVSVDTFFAFMNEYDDDKDVVYSSYIFYGEFQPTKKYVCVIPVSSKGADFENYEWLDTSQGALYVSKLYNDYGSIMQCKIKILPREAQ